MSIINFTVNFDLFASQTDSSDSGVDADIVPLIGTVTFTPLTTDNRPILAPTYTPRPAGFKVLPFTGYLDVDGRLKSERSGATGVRLWANDPVLKLNTLNYKVEFDLRTPLGERVKVDPGYFTAPSTDVSVQLADVLQSTGTVSLSTLFPQGPKGDRGYGFAGLTAALDGTAVQGLVETATGTAPVGLPVPVSVAYNSTVTHGSVASTARPPVSVAVIWIGSVQPTNALNGDVWMDISGTAPTITTTTLAALNRGVVVDQQLLATGTTPLIWDISAGSLPAGVTLSSTGYLAGNPTASGAYSFTARATNGYGTNTKALSGTVGSYVAPTVTTTSLGGVVSAGASYLQVLMTSGSIPVTWSIVSGALPDGLALTSAGTISGTPTASGSYSFTVRATNSAGYADQAFAGTVSGAAPTITTTSLNSISQGAAFTQTPAASGTTPFTWTVPTGSLPAGLSLNSSTGNISGTPTGTGAYSFTVRATNPYGYGEQAYSGTVAPGTPVISTSALSSVYRAVAFTQTLAFTGATPVTWSVSAGSLPTGISLNTSTGVLSGTATTVAAYSFTITATNSYGTGTKAFTGNVLESSPGITGTTLNTLRATQAFSQTLTGTGLTPITWSVPTGSLPAGLSLNTSTGVISGTPTTTGAYSVTVRATNSVGYYDRTFTGSVLNLGVSYSASGTYGQTAGTSYSINGPSAAIGDTIVVWIEWNALSTPTFSATYDGTAMTAKGSIAFSTGVFGLSCLTITGVSAAGVKSIAVTSSVSAAMRVYSVAYSGATSVGTLITDASSSASLTQNITSSTGNMIAQAFGHYPNSNTGSVSSYSQTQRNNVSASISIYTINFIVGDASGASSVTFNATAANTGAWATAAIQLIP